MQNKKITVILFLISILFTFSISAIGAESKEGIKKKFLFIKDDDSDFFNGFAKFIEAQVRAKGYTADKVEYKVMSMKGKGANGKKLLKEIKKYNPTVVFMNCVYAKDMVVPLKKENISTVVIGGIEYEENGKSMFLDKNGMPSGSVAGNYGYIQNREYNTFRLMEEIVPLKGRKIAVLIGNDLPNIKLIKKAAKDFGAELKIYPRVKYVEDMQKLIEKVNGDKEVGWVLPYVPFNRKDGKEVNREEIFKLLYQSIDKPNMTFWQNDIEKGAMMGITIDSTGLVLQAIEMAYKILDGEKPKNIKPVYPERSFFLLNFVTTQRLKLKVPINIIDGAWRVYTDYEGHFEGHK